MRRIATRLLLLGVALAGLAGLAFGIASLSTASASTSVTSAHVLASSSSTATATPTPGTRTCPNMGSSGPSSTS
jgi:hypothetical protein